MNTCTEYNGCRSGHCWPTCSLEQTELIDLVVTHGNADGPLRFFPFAVPFSSNLVFPLKKHQTKPPAFTESTGPAAPSLERVHVASFLQPNADRREGAPPLARVMPCRDRPVEC
ncbi:hypothetical protein ALC56_09296 [Trachymyrmex septentrionalis]|uniref:Uncharacterized protein n=1 Tax=Trachymyrmex septentrionalis TaxID=34720 RepID=A0A195F7H3_9HYME|nr:hypothetical protein ALC56_09296 [Trachymyrmex septentrionalis]